LNYLKANVFDSLYVCNVELTASANSVFATVIV